MLVVVRLVRASPLVEAFLDWPTCRIAVGFSKEDPGIVVKALSKLGGVALVAAVDVKLDVSDDRVAVWRSFGCFLGLVEYYWPSSGELLRPGQFTPLVWVRATR